MLEEWYKEGLSCHKTAKFTSEKSNSLLYKGFKIVLDLEFGGMQFLDMRKTDFYSSVTENDLIVFREHGFVKGCDLIMRDRDQQRVNNYTKRLEKLYTLKDEYKKDPVKNKKRLGICEANIAETIDLLFFHKSRLIQNTEKYENN